MAFNSFYATWKSSFFVRLIRNNHLVGNLPLTRKCFIRQFSELAYSLSFLRVETILKIKEFANALNL